MGRMPVNTCWLSGVLEARRKFNILKLTRGSWQGRAQGLGSICPCFSGRVDGWWTANESEGHKTSLNIGGCVNS